MWHSEGLCEAVPAKKTPGTFFVLAAVVTLAAGCHLPPPQPRKPNYYEVRGRVVDAETGAGVPTARVRLRAVLAGPVGAQYLTAYAVTRDDGSYRVEVSATFDVMQDAGEVRLDASKAGYIPGGADLPPPEKKRNFYKAPDIVVQPGRAPTPPPDLERLGVPITEPSRPNPVPRKR